MFHPWRLNGSARLLALRLFYADSYILSVYSTHILFQTQNKCKSQRSMMYTRNCHGKYLFRNASARCVFINWIDFALHFQYLFDIEKKLKFSWRGHIPMTDFDLANCNNVLFIFSLLRIYQCAWHCICLFLRIFHFHMKWFYYFMLLLLFFFFNSINCMDV